ncbi:MAG: T9SS type A sorting domain-containing protein [Bacteroidales bacterium]|nr:T9SS type A sorting domain-containing protein [Bacteroidales bacterium]
MKNIFTFLLCLIAISLGAQSFTLTYEGSPLVNNATINIPTTTGAGVETFVDITNNSQTDLFFRIYQEGTWDANVTSITFCAGGTCYVSNQSQELYLAPGATLGSDIANNRFHSAFSSSVAGTHSVRYKFVNSDDANDTIAFTINYNVSTGLEEVTRVNKLTVYPNPATTAVTVEYDLNNVSNAYVVVRNLTGMEVCRVPASVSGKTRVDVSSLRAGVYFYGIESDGRMLSSKKLLVK